MRVPKVQRLERQKAKGRASDRSRDMEPEETLPKVPKNNPTSDKPTKMKQELLDLLKKNAKLILLEQQEDGNWRGAMVKNGKVIEVRAIGPETVLQLLLTHE